MSSKGYWVCKCGFKHKLTPNQIKDGKFRKCEICRKYPSKKDINKAKKQIDNSIINKFVRALTFR